MFRRAIQTVAALAGALLLSMAAGADFPRTVQPIRAADLKCFGDLLLLSDEQRLAAEMEWEKYLDEFEPLRLEMMEVASQHPRYRYGMDQQFIRLVPPFVIRARELDERFFNRLEDILSPKQRESLPRVRVVRERALYERLDVVARFIGNGIPDLRELLESLGLPREASDPVTPLLEGYEQRHAQSIRAIYEAAMRLCGQNDDAAADVLIERVRSLRAMNRRMFEEVERGLPQEWKRLWRDLFFERAYASALNAAQVPAVNFAEAALRLEDLDPSQRTSIERIRQEARDAQDRELMKLLDLHDANCITRPPASGPVGWEYFRNAQKTWQRQQEKQQELDRLLHSALTETQYRAVVATRPWHPLRSLPVQRQHCDVVAYIQVPYQPATDSQISDPDPMLARGIGREEMADYIAGLVDDQAKHAILWTLHADYLAALESELRPLRHERMTMEITQSPADPFERPTRMREIWREMRSKVEAADALLFENMRQLLDRPADDPVLVRVVQLRERTRIMPRLSSQSPSDANRAAGIDLVRLLLRHHGPDIGGELAERVREYETRLMELAQARLELLNELLYQARARRDGLQDLSSQEGVSKHITEADAFTRSHHALATLNAATLPRLVPLLDVSVGNALTDEFNRAAYPPAYEDRFEMRQALAAAFALPDLLPSQRDDLFTLQMEYREQYETARRGVIEACAAFPIAFPRVTMYGTAAYQAAHARYERESSKALEERAAVNRRALRGLRLTLSPAQLRKLPLPEVE